MNPAALPRSGLGKAIGYALSLWDGLVRFVDDARIPIDTNLVERGMRPVAVGRKNHYGSKSERGTRVAALFYTLIESAKHAGVEPAGYLAEAGRSITPVRSRCRAISRRSDLRVARIRGKHRADHDVVRDGVRRALTHQLRGERRDADFDAQRSTIPRWRDDREAVMDGFGALGGGPPPLTGFRAGRIGGDDSMGCGLCQPGPPTSTITLARHIKSGRLSLWEGTNLKQCLC